MGNLLACGSPIRVCASAPMKPSTLARLVHMDGTIEDITEPVTVAELMLEHPLHFVCHVNPEVARDDPLPADTHLERGEVYYLRSNTGPCSKSPLREMKRSLTGLTREKKTGFLSMKAGFLSMKQKGSVTQVTVSADFVAKLLRENHMRKVTEDVTEEQRVMQRSVSWRPKLATIQESVF